MLLTTFVRRFAALSASPPFYQGLCFILFLRYFVHKNVEFISSFLSLLSDSKCLPVSKKLYLRGIYYIHCQKKPLSAEYGQKGRTKKGEKRKKRRTITRKYKVDLSFFHNKQQMKRDIMCQPRDHALTLLTKHW